MPCDNTGVAKAERWRRPTAPPAHLWPDTCLIVRIRRRQVAKRFLEGEGKGREEKGSEGGTGGRKKGIGEGRGSERDERERRRRKHGQGRGEGK